MIIVCPARGNPLNAFPALLRHGFSPRSLSGFISAGARTPALFAGFGVAHLSDDILFGVPEESYMSRTDGPAVGAGLLRGPHRFDRPGGPGHPGQLSGADPDRVLARRGRHPANGPEIPQAGSFHSEPWSAVFSIGLVISGLILAGTAYGALRHSDQEARSTRKKAV